MPNERNLKPLIPNWSCGAVIKSTTIRLIGTGFRSRYQQNFNISMRRCNTTVLSLYDGSSDRSLVVDSLLDGAYKRSLAANQKEYPT